VEDHHVDRPDVEARQRVKLTGTNRSFDLIALVAKARDLSSQSVSALGLDKNQKNQFCFTVLRRPGGLCKVIRPDPIPNSAVKRLSADGTLSQDMGE
jgi:hypothetical protein